MSQSPARKFRSLSTKVAQITIAVPQVIAHRTLRLAMAGPLLSERDRKEFRLMGSEKVIAFSESWGRMAIHLLRVNHKIAMSLLSPWRLLSLKNKPTTALLTQMQTATLEVLDKGVGPLHRGTTANARRLSKTRLRQ